MNEAWKYRLTVGGYSGDVGDAMAAAPHSNFNANGRNFGTPDRDYDIWADDNCGALFKSGWWFGWCSRSDLNRDGLAIWMNDFDEKASRMLVKLK